MKRQIIAVSVALACAVAFASIVQAVPDDGHLRPFIQPDSSVFMGRGFGDEFIHRFETEDGYTFVKDYADHWYYYAQVDGQGDLVPTEWRVGTVDPQEKGIPQYLDFTDPKRGELLAVRDSVNAQRIPEPLYENVNLGVILIEFPDEKHKSCLHDKPGYRMSTFENLFFSDETYVPPTRAPWCDYDEEDEDQVFGSVNDFWQEVAYGQMSIIGDILNLDNGANYPVWYEAGNCMDYYNTGSGNLYQEAITAAEAAGFDPDSYDILCILYAGDWNVQGYGNGLWPHAVGNHYFMSETQSYDAGEYFCHIGVHCHEIGHLLGLRDKYDYPGEPGYWDLMGYGWRLSWPGDPEVGNRIHGACPAHINAISKLQLGWLEPTYVDGQLPDRVLFPAETSNEAYIYQVHSEQYKKEFFVVEYRTTQGQGYKFDKYTYYAPDPSTDGVLIWHAKRPYGAGHLYETVERADNDYDDPVGDLWPGNTGKDAFTPVSTPSTGGYPTDTQIDSLLGHQPVATGFSTEGIIRNQSPLSIEASFYNNRWAGDIVSPTVWSGLQYVVGDVTVWIKPFTVHEDTFEPGDRKLLDVDSALVVSPGANVRFSSQAELEIKGAFIAEGTADSVITFTSAAQYPEDGDWGEIVFYKESADSFSLLKYCDISYSMYGVVCLGSSLPISFCNIYKNRMGIICCDSSFSRIDTCSVYNNVHDGIWCCNGSSPVVHRCSIYSNGDYGLINDDSTVTVLADSNWWGGDTTGPYDPSPGPPDYNPEGKGDKVSDYVIYRPWRKYGEVGVNEPISQRSLPKTFSLSQNYPNPFNPTTVISYQLSGVSGQESVVSSQRSAVSLKIYNILGQEVRTLVDKKQLPGYYSVEWDGRDNSGKEVSSGIYIYRIQAGDFTQPRRMLLLK